MESLLLEKEGPRRKKGTARPAATERQAGKALTAAMSQLPLLFSSSMRNRERNPATPRLAFSGRGTSWCSPRGALPPARRVEPRTARLPVHPARRVRSRRGTAAVRANTSWRFFTADSALKAGTTAAAQGKRRSRHFRPGDPCGANDTRVRSRGVGRAPGDCRPGLNERRSQNHSGVRLGIWPSHSPPLAPKAILKSGSDLGFRPRNFLQISARLGCDSS